MPGNPSQGAREEFMRQTERYLGETCPIYLSFKTGHKVPSQCKRCEGQSDICRTYHAYMEIRGVPIPVKDTATRQQ